MTTRRQLIMAGLVILAVVISLIVVTINDTSIASALLQPPAQCTNTNSESAPSGGLDYEQCTTESGN